MTFLNSIWPWKKFRAYERDLARLRNELMMAQRELDKTKGNIRKLGEILARVGGISVMVCLLTVGAPAQQIPRNPFTTNFITAAPANGWFIVWSNGVPQWAINGGLLTNVTAAAIAGTGLPQIAFTSGGYNLSEAVVTGQPRFVSLWGSLNQTGSATEANVSQVSYSTGYYTNLCYTETLIGTGTNITCTLVTNGVISNLAKTLVGTGSTVAGCDTTHGVPVAGSNTVSLRFTSTNPSLSVTTRINWSVMFVLYP